MSTPPPETIQQFPITTLSIKESYIIPKSDSAPPMYILFYDKLINNWIIFKNGFYYIIDENVVGYINNEYTDSTFYTHTQSNEFRKALKTITKDTEPTITESIEPTAIKEGRVLQDNLGGKRRVRKSSRKHRRKSRNHLRRTRHRK